MVHIFFIGSTKGPHDALHTGCPSRWAEQVASLGPAAAQSYPVASPRACDMSPKPPPRHSASCPLGRQQREPWRLHVSYLAQNNIMVPSHILTRRSRAKICGSLRKSSCFWMSPPGKASTRDQLSKASLCLKPNWRRTNNPLSFHTLKPAAGTP